MLQKNGIHFAVMQGYNIQDITQICNAVCLLLS